MLNKNKKHLTSLTMAACFALTLTLGLTGTAAANEVSLEVDYWKPAVSGEMKASNTNVNLRDDLGLDRKGVPGFTLRLQQNNQQQMYVNYHGTTFESTQNLPRSLNFEGGNYAAGDNVNSKLKVNHLQVGLRNEKVTSSGKLSTIYSYTHGNIETSLQDKNLNFSRSRKNSINSFGIGLGWESTKSAGINFFAQATPLSFSQKGQGFWEYNLGIKTNLSRNTGMTIGYKYERMGDDDSDLKEVTLKGAYLFLGSNF